MADPKPQAWWDTIRQARLLRVLAVCFGVSFAVIQLVDVFTDQLGLPDWFFPGATALQADFQADEGDAQLAADPELQPRVEAARRAIRNLAFDG